MMRLRINQSGRPNFSWLAYLSQKPFFTLHQSWSHHNSQVSCEHACSAIHYTKVDHNSEVSCEHARSAIISTLQSSQYIPGSKSSQINKSLWSWIQQAWFPRDPGAGLGIMTGQFCTPQAKPNFPGTTKDDTTETLFMNRKIAIEN